MLYIATVHYRSPLWIEIQTAHLREHVSVPFQVWTSLEGIDPSYARHFDRVLDQRGSHAGKLNHLAFEISLQATDDDLILFLDGDAFPIADPMPLIDAALGRSALVAVRRAENADEPQPHPCFCATTMGTWNALPGDWTAGPVWPGARGKPTTDVGGNLMRRLEARGMRWEEVLRSNKHDIDPLYFGVYGDCVYHHGAGFRTGELSPAHREHAPRPLPVPAFGPLRPLRRVANGLRWRRWERSMQRHQVRESARVYESIRGGGDGWLGELM